MSTREVQNRIPGTKRVRSRGRANGDYETQNTHTSSAENINKPDNQLDIPKVRSNQNKRSRVRYLGHDGDQWESSKVDYYVGRCQCA